MAARDPGVHRSHLRSGRALGTDFQENEVLVASIHGNAERFAQVLPDPDSACASDDNLVTFSCATSLGRAYSGDRKAWMCASDFSPALQAFGEFLTTE